MPDFARSVPDQVPALRGRSAVSATRSGSFMGDAANVREPCRASTKRRLIIMPWQCYCSFHTGFSREAGIRDCVYPFVVLKKGRPGPPLHPVTADRQAGMRVLTTAAERGPS